METEDISLEKLSTEVALNQKTFSLIDDIIEKFNLKYANADRELNEMVENLCSDDSLVVNVRDSTPSAYEAAIADRVSLKITDGLLDGTINGDEEKTAFYTELSRNKAVVTQITNAVIRKIKDLILAG